MATKATATKAKTTKAAKPGPFTNARKQATAKKPLAKTAAKKPTTKVIAGTKKAASKGTGARKAK
jgi:hypothetical protein